ncbi:chromosome segregation protein SMC [Chroococcidiopsis sp. CCALA 051]|uniref:AAA family ATPase n=1 Tax=Chroococcidiopsis sp. CCALA 051 TaxID=869949 RepID=UPI000D0DFC92|nr:AAA family ATPase [Chroococcidiopsis sp. CCALA 051]MBE9015514.1 AAA family ATPase [Chroococcidiopsidales cyanobacterium LEGE 13417]PSM45753.1 chromosome segregation protein SMC [Chroococcidiopsis sp. CCALA 051]
MEGKKIIHSLKLQNFLSFGSEGEEIELQPLNVLIGANASGKSNLIEAFGILKALPTDLLAPIRRGGGVSEFLWKGSDDIPTAQIEAIVDYPEKIPLCYKLNFASVNQRVKIIEELVIDRYPYEGEEGVALHYRSRNNGNSILIGYDPTTNTKKPNQKISEQLNFNQSILSQISSIDMLYPEIIHIRSYFANIELYREWNMGHNSKIRMPQPTDLPEHPLLEDASNFGMYLNNLQHQIGARKIIEKLKVFYEEAEELTTKIYGGTVQTFIRETGLTQPIPATRLSDGTLHYLFLMALLLDPTPPLLTCIEEPEIGLHPDMMPTIADMLIEASQRTQLVVTTHSESLISALPPESVVVCERDYDGTRLRRLDPKKLKEWLKEYSLGHIWSAGEIGGTRW